MNGFEYYWISIYDEKLMMERKLCEFFRMPTNSAEVVACDYYHNDLRNPLEPLSSVKRFVPCGPDDPEVIRKCLVLFCGNLFQECPSYLEAKKDLKDYGDVLWFDDRTPASLMRLIKESKKIKISEKFHIGKGSFESVREY